MDREVGSVSEMSGPLHCCRPQLRTVGNQEVATEDLSTSLKACRLTGSISSFSLLPDRQQESRTASPDSEASENKPPTGLASFCQSFMRMPRSALKSTEISKTVMKTRNSARKAALPYGSPARRRSTTRVEDLADGIRGMKLNP